MSNYEISTLRLGLTDELGPVLYTREEGQVLSDYIYDLEPGILLIADFENAEIVGAPFLLAAFEGLRSHLKRAREENPLLLLTNLDQLGDEMLDLVLTSSRSPISGVVVAKEGTVDLMIKSPHIKEAFLAAKKLTTMSGCFTASQLADELGLQVPNTNQRLAKLNQTGSITRTLDSTAEHGKRYIYRSITDSDVVWSR